MEPTTTYPATDEVPNNLRPELAIVRQVMNRLLLLWDEQGTSLTPAEGRRLAALIFNGARTAAVLLYHQQRLPDRGDEQAWLAAALAALGEQHELEL